MNQVSEEKGYYGDGTGNGRVDAVEIISPSSGGSGINLPSYSITAQLSNLDPCGKKNIRVGFTSVGQVNFNIRAHSDGSIGTGQMSPDPVAFEDKLDKGVYAFEVPITNLQETCADEKLTGNYLFVYTNELTIKITHTPMMSDVYMR
jgi:hypothetical protein